MWTHISTCGVEFSRVLALGWRSVSPTVAQSSITQLHQIRLGGKEEATAWSHVLDKI